MAPSYDESFVALVQQHLEPTLMEAGFRFNEVGLDSPPVSVPLERGTRSNWFSRRLRRTGQQEPATWTMILYEADVEAFAAAFPGSEEDAAPDCKDFWLWYEPSTGAIEIDLQGENVDLADWHAAVHDASRPLEGRVVALARAFEEFLRQARSTD